MNNQRLLGISFGSGILLTLLSAIVPAQTLLGAVQYGYPLPWLIRRTLGPEQFPWQVNALGLLVDLFLWTVLVFAFLLVFERIRR